MIILTHIGETLPEYIDTFLTQLRKFNNQIEIVFLVNENNVNNTVFTNHNIKTYSIEHLDNTLTNQFINKFGHGDINSSKKHIVYGSPDYWCVTSTRLFYIYEYCKIFNIKEYFHFENDIMVYSDVNDILSIIKDNNLYENIAITRGTNNKIMTGFMYVGDNDIMGDILKSFILYLDNKADLFKYGIDMINEMGLLHIYQIKNPEKLVNLPTFPNEILTQDFKYFNTIFDPATYGQYLDGIPSNPGISILPDSYIGDEIRKDSSISITFESVDDLRIPYLNYGDEKIKINTLHIHSKRLYLFLS
jgi:hypothetical protein